MPSLIPEILFEIGKKLVKDGKSDAVIKYAFSGKEQLKTMKNVFASVSFLEFNETHYSIGWNDKSCCKFELNNDKPNSKFLMDNIGNSVINLEINRPFTILFRVMYRPIFQKIKAAKRKFFFFFD
uniref:Uncharacterized protein n=1 Tax=Panagrolaimus davidi TaxID=227884 RepID=A0A914PEL1_9BILA